MSRESDERYINRLVTGHYWNDIKEVFDDMADTSTHQIYYNENYYQCKMEGNFCIGAEFAFQET